MKKPIFITLLVLVCLGLAGVFSFLGYTAYNYSQTLDNYDAMEQEKTITVDDGAIFTNPRQRTTDVSMVKRSYAEYKYVYQKNNIHFLSNVDAWNEDMLSLLADELYANKHGDEIDYVSTVILNEGTEGDYIGSHESNRETFLLPAALYDFLPNVRYKARTMLAEINLYEADNYVTIEDMSVVLSHEYGHHFTNHYFGLTFTETDKNTDYYQLRGAGNDKVLLTADTMDEYIENHMWYLNEFAAEDYVYFLGSANAHRIVEFYDTVDKVGAYARGGDNALDKINYSYDFCRNGTPHENVSGGLPDDVEGLEEYFYSFISEEPPAKEQREPIGTLNLKMEKTNAKEHEFTWNQPYKDADVLYTLILYDDDDDVMFMVRTRDGNEKGLAHFGYYKYNITKGYWIYTYTFGWDLDLGTKMRARVSILFPDGSILLSDPLDFEY